MDNDERMIQEFLHNGYCCSQVIVAMGLKARGEDNLGLLTASSGLCMGVHGGLTCGIFTGAALVLALFDKKNAEKHMIPELLEWYEETYAEKFGGMNCLDISKDGIQPARCARLLQETWKEVKSILQEYGFDLQEKR